MPEVDNALFEIESCAEHLDPGERVEFLQELIAELETWLNAAQEML